jgi:hypothetical protein
MANDVQNKDNEIDDDSINIDDIEGLERDLTPKNEANNQSLENVSSQNQENEALEILEGGKLKTATENSETSLNQAEEEELFTKQKNKKSIKILLAILLVLIIGIIAFVLMSSEEKIEEKLPVEATQTVVLPPIETYEFKLDHINVSRLNKKLENLSKYELLGMTEEEYLKEEKIKAIKKAQEEEALKEKMRLEEEALEKEALEKTRLSEELAKKANDKPLLEVKANEENMEEEPTQNNKKDVKEASTAVLEEANVSDSIGNNFLKFVQINTNKRVILKTYLKQVQTIDERVNACRNINENIEIFVGPLKNDENYTSIIEAIKNAKLSTDVMFIEVTKEEFSKRCMVEEN